MSSSLDALIDGYLTTQLLWIAARLLLADRVASRARSSHNLARKTGIDALVMQRPLRGLAGGGVLVDQPGATFPSTGLGSRSGQIIRSRSRARRSPAAGSPSRQPRGCCRSFREA